MPWTSRYNAKFTKPLIRQMIAIAQRDSRDALDFVGGTDPTATSYLKSFVSYQLAPQTTPQFPAIGVFPERTEFDRDANNSLHSVNRVFIGVAANHQDPEVLSELIQDYVRAVDAIFNTVPLSDFYSSLPLTLRIIGKDPINTTPLDYGTLKDLWIASHQYDEIQKGRNGYAIVSVLEVHVDREEI